MARGTSPRFARPIECQISQIDRVVASTLSRAAAVTAVLRVPAIICVNAAAILLRTTLVLSYITAVFTVLSILIIMCAVANAIFPGRLALTCVATVAVVLMALVGLWRLFALGRCTLRYAIFLVRQFLGRRRAPSPLLKLPYDIRHQIYQLLVAEARIEVRKDSSRSCGATLDYSNYPLYLLNACHQLRVEIQPILNNHNILIVAWKNPNTIGLQPFWASIPLHVLHSVKRLQVITQRCPLREVSLLPPLGLGCALPNLRSVTLWIDLFPDTMHSHADLLTWTHHPNTNRWPIWKPDDMLDFGIPAIKQMVNHKLPSVLPPGVKISLIIISTLWNWRTRPVPRNSRRKISNLAAIVVKEGKAWVDAVSEGRGLWDSDKMEIMRGGDKQSAVIIDRFYQNGVDIS